MNKPKAEMGKFTIESLTTGMYDNHLVIYREYIQNCADSIDKAVNEGVISRVQALIDIIVDKDKREVEIIDNGMGIPSGIAYKTLVDIGKSTKEYSSNRGFRGIGRLAGSAYCNKLIFETSFKGEENKSIVIFDCALMKSLLIPGESDHLSAEGVLDIVTSYESVPEEKEKHYFRVRMLEISDQEESILDVVRVTNYLSQVAPVPFDRGKFVFTSEIMKLFEENSTPLIEYKISIGESRENLKPIYKPYKHRYSLFSKKESEEIISIEPILKESDGKLLYIGWYARTNLQGACSDEQIKGIRLRKGNIMVGDSSTLSELFREARFNSWYVGEIHVLDPSVIPNARRDNFELNNSYYQIRTYLLDLFDKLSSDIRDASKKRNEGEIKVIKLIENADQKISAMLKSGASSKVEKQKIFELLGRAATSAEKIKTTTKVEKEKIEELKSEIQKLEDKLEEKVKYKGNDIPSSYSKKEKKIVQVIFEIIDECLEEDVAKKLTDKIIQKLKN